MKKAVILFSLLLFCGCSHSGDSEKPVAYSECYRIPLLEKYYEEAYGKKLKWKFPTACRNDNPFAEKIKAADDGIIGYKVSACPDLLAFAEAGDEWEPFLRCGKKDIICQRLPCKP